MNRLLSIPRTHPTTLSPRLPNRNLLSALDYGNNDGVDYTYDSEGRLTGETYEDGDTVSYTYTNNGSLAKVTDSATGITTTYYYDLIDRLGKYRETGANRDHSVEYTYDSNNNLSRLEETTNGTKQITGYTYDGAGRIEKVSSSISGSSNTSEERYTYDTWHRITAETIKHNDTDVLTESYTYTDLYWINNEARVTTTQVASKQIDAAGYDVTFTYTYDDNGNILSVSDGTYTTTYVYDSANQLIRENNPVGNFTYTWEYDGAGNILARNRYAYTTGELGSAITNEYTYGGAWGDLLASYNGFEFTYDEIGNLLSDNMYTYTWEHGRELATLFDGLSTWTYTYDANGMRTSASNGVTTYTYVYNGGSLSQMTVGNDTFYFTYDAAGNPMTVTYNGTVYYYVTNLQGDVIAILDSAGMPVTTYAYDAWGHPVSMSGSMVSTLGYQNPLRYRGYVYDNHSGFYYLQTRYYNPMRGRFINADALVSTSQGLLGNNMFAYCLNNPVNYSDPTGAYAQIWPTLFGAHDPGALHRAVQFDIILNQAFRKELYLPGIGRADIYCPETHEIWEIKHGGSTVEMQSTRIHDASKQAEKYLVNHNGKQLQLGHAGAFESSFPLNCGGITYLITYNTPEPGVILYFAKQEKKYNPAPSFSYLPSERKLEQHNKLTMATVGFTIAYAGAGALIYAKQFGY